MIKWAIIKFLHKVNKTKQLERLDFLLRPNPLSPFQDNHSFNFPPSKINGVCSIKWYTRSFLMTSSLHLPDNLKYVLFYCATISATRSVIGNNSARTLNIAAQPKQHSPAVIITLVCKQLLAFFCDLTETEEPFLVRRQSNTSQFCICSSQSTLLYIDTSLWFHRFY